MDGLWQRLASLASSRIARGLSWSAFGLLASRGLSLAARLLLARLLTPEIFGLLAMIMVCIGLVSVAQDFGLKQSLIQRKHEAVSSARYSSVFWFVLGSSLVWAFVIATVGAPLIGALFSEPEVVPLARVMALMVIFSGLSLFPEIRLVRSLRFKQLTIAELISISVSLSIALVLAYLGAGAWALVAQQVSNQGVRSVILWRQTKWRPRFRYQFELIREVWRFSSFALGSQILNHIRLNTDKILIGAIVGSSALGAYTLAYLITETIRAQIGAVVARVMFPVFSKNSLDLERMRAMHLSVVKYMCLIVFPFATVLGLEAETIVPLAFGSQWAESVLPTSILSVAAAIMALGGDPGSLLKGLGKPGTVFTLHTINTFVIGLPAIATGAYYFGIVGAAYGVLFQTAINFGMMAVAVYQNVGTSIFQMLNAAFPGMLVALCFAALCLIY